MENIKFNTTVAYNDPDFRFIDVNVIGDAGITKGEPEHAKKVIELALAQILNAISSERVSYKDLPSQIVRMKQEVPGIVKDNGVELGSLNIMAVGPSDKAKAFIERMTKINEMAKMSPEELAKKAEEAQRKAQEQWNMLTPEQQAQAMQNAEIARKKFEEEHKDVLAHAQAVASGGSPDDISKALKMAANAAGGAAAAASTGAAANKFCTNCGTPSKGGAFCCNCGAKL